MTCWLSPECGFPQQIYVHVALMLQDDSHHNCPMNELPVSPYGFLLTYIGAFVITLCEHVIALCEHEMDPN